VKPSDQQIYRLGVPDKVIRALPRQSIVNLTLGYYIKPQTHDVIAAMGKFEAETAAHTLRTPKGHQIQPRAQCPNQPAALEGLGWS